MNSFLLLCDVNLLVFWKKLKRPKRHFEIDWPLTHSPCRPFTLQPPLCSPSDFKESCRGYFILLYWVLHSGFDATRIRINQVQIRVSNGSGQCNFSGRRDRSSFTALSWDKGTTRQTQNLAKGRDWIFYSLSCPISGRPRVQSLSILYIKCTIFFLWFPALEHLFLS